MPARPPFLPSALRWVASGLNSLAHFVPLLLVSPFSPRAARAIYLHWGRTALRIFGVTLSLRDDNEGDRGPPPHLYVSLNQSNVAEPVIFAMLLPPLFGIANIEYAAMPFFGWAVVPLRYVVIVRQWKDQAKRGVERAAARLVSGETCCMSIEGARSPDGRLLPYKKGAVVLALASQATLIPMVNRGSRALLPPGEWRARAGHVEVHLLKAIPTRGLSYADRDTVLEQLRALAERELEPVSTQGLQPQTMDVHACAAVALPGFADRNASQGRLQQTPDFAQGYETV